MNGIVHRARNSERYRLRFELRRDTGHFIDGFESPEWFVEPGISIRIREFTLDFHLNQERLYDKDVTLFNSFGLELNFGRF